MRGKKARKGLLHLVTNFCLCLLLCVSLIGLASCKKGSDVPLSSGLSVIEGRPIYDDAVAMQTDHFSVTPGMMAFFFYTYGGELIAEMEKTVAYDSSKTLHDQIYADGLSFYDVLMNSTLQRVSEMLIYCEAAHAANVTLSEGQRAAISNDITSLRVEAASYGLELETYLQQFYGPLIKAEDLQRIYECEALAASYSATVTKELEAGITAQEAQAYAQANGLSDSTPSRNIAYLAIPYVGGKPNETDVANAMQALQNAPEAKTIEGLSAIGSVGVEENLTKDNTGVSAIADWLYEAGRSIGDYGRTETAGATYILLYTGNGMSFSEVSARMSLYDAAFATWYNNWVEALDFGYNYDILDSYDISE